MDTSHNVSQKDLDLCKKFFNYVYESFQSKQKTFNFELTECGINSVSKLTNNNTKPQALHNPIDQLGFNGQNCSLAKLALDTPEGKSRVVVMILSSKLNDYAMQFADELKSDNARIMVLGVGPKVDLKQMEGIATSSLYALKVPKFEYLRHMAQTVRNFIGQGRMKSKHPFFFYIKHHLHRM